jgi:hypothetical protein
VAHAHPTPFTSLLRLNPSDLVPPYTGVDFAVPPHQVVADLQEKRGAHDDSSSPLSH